MEGIVKKWYHDEFGNVSTNRIIAMTSVMLGGFYLLNALGMVWLTGLTDYTFEVAPMVTAGTALCTSGAVTKVWQRRIESTQTH